MLKKNWGWVLLSVYVSLFWGAYILYFQDEWNLSFGDAMLFFSPILFCGIVVKCFISSPTYSFDLSELNRIHIGKEARDFYPIPGKFSYKQSIYKSIKLRGDSYRMNLKGFGDFLPFEINENVSKTIKSYDDACIDYKNRLNKYNQYKERYNREREVKIEELIEKLVFCLLFILVVLIFCLSYRALLSLNIHFICSVLVSLIFALTLGWSIFKTAIIILYFPAVIIKPFIIPILISNDFKDIRQPSPPSKPHSLELCLKHVEENEKRIDNCRKKFASDSSELLLFPEDVIAKSVTANLDEYIDYLAKLSCSKSEKALIGYWDEISPRNFEYEVATYYRERGYGVEVTQYSQDGGIDIILKKKDGTKVYVQCKHYVKDKVTIETAKELGGTMYVDGVKEGVIACLRGVTQGAADYMYKAKIELLTAEDLAMFYRWNMPINNVKICKNNDYWIQIWKFFLSTSVFYKLEDAIQYVKGFEAPEPHKEYIVTRFVYYHIIFGEKKYLNLYFEEPYDCWRVYRQESL